MKPRWPTVLLIALLAGTAAGFGVLFSMRLNRGDSFPVYSSQRADPLGTRVLYDSLSELPGLHVRRSYASLAELADQPSRTIVLAGLNLADGSGVSEATSTALDRTVRRGSRLIIALHAVHDVESANQTVGSVAKSKEKKKPEKKGEEPKAEKPKQDEVKPEPRVNLGEKWSAPAQKRLLMGDARRADPAPVDFPERLRWGSDVFFKLEANTPWTVLYRRGTEPVVIERTLGRGSIVMMADAYFLSNEAMQRDRAPALLAWLIGREKEIEFNEGALGVFEDPGIMALARSYGLTGAFIAFAIAAALFIWNRTALFVPPADESVETALTYNQVAGLEALMRRTFARDELTAACLKEWRATAREVDVARAQHAADAAPPKSTPALIYNTIVRALRRRTPSSSSSL
jgi:hypothetical protein